MIKECLICGLDEKDLERLTCVACGEASWLQHSLVVDEDGKKVKAIERLDLVDDDEPEQPKRRRGRPRKNP